MSDCTCWIVWSLDNMVSFSAWFSSCRLKISSSLSSSWACCFSVSSFSDCNLISSSCLRRLIWCSFSAESSKSTWRRVYCSFRVEISVVWFFLVIASSSMAEVCCWRARLWSSILLLCCVHYSSARASFWDNSFKFINYSSDINLSSVAFAKDASLAARVSLS